MKTRGWLFVFLFVFVVALCVPMGGVALSAEEGVSVSHGDVVAHGASHHGVAGGGHEAVSHEEGGHGEHGGHEGHHGLTHMQIMNFVWHCLNFSILAFVLFRLLKKPIGDALRGRREEIENSFSDLEEKRREAERKYAEYEKKLSKMDEEAERILQSFIAQGEAEKEKIIQQARDAAERIKMQAELYIEQELDKARQELKREVAEMSVDLAGDIIKKNLNEQDHHKLISEYLEKVVTKN